MVDVVVFDVLQKPVQFAFQLQERHPRKAIPLRTNIPVEYL